MNDTIDKNVGKNATNKLSRKTIYVLIFILVVSIVSYLSLLPDTVFTPSIEQVKKDSLESNTNQKINYINATNDLIVVSSPQPDDVVERDLNIVGKARGGWFFEASFPVEILDMNGNLITTSIAQAITTKDGGWMTSDFVNFEANIKIPQSYSGQITVVLKKDNPSGESVRDASISFQLNLK